MVWLYLNRPFFKAFGKPQDIWGIQPTYPLAVRRAPHGKIGALRASRGSRTCLLAKED